ncbi:quinone-dependent dihydroorotate dehydrogenase [Motiliproteus sp. MSK22-1]|uniref:quinone-dependent dihydroorotate dehydrogenase n=1 Tax=Motiliproteus sp. MSK22-1 TaxID=1897630 RepID=UPI000975BE41|nr:quinone-dependent dihydroorotate dehydrogenase [Motiliproteus sp. MSK22-1]OMH32849.1 dihydroorotate dehydrogenase (quinone) [Motiliproteus sp. MSK22-1]
MSYSYLQSLLFKFEPETSHNLAMKGMDLSEHLGVSSLLYQAVDAPKEVMGLYFPNSVGLAAGLDKDGAHIDALAALGFGFIEVGTVTPRPQPGNAKPRLFRIPESQAIINRMGFNNRGVDNLLKNLHKTRFEGVLGINIGKNFDTPVENANSDYLLCLRKVYSRASYVTVNVSSPNTPGLRDLQFGDSLNSLLDALKTEQKKLAEFYGYYVPVTVKIAPDMAPEEIDMVADSLASYEMDAVIATNTTLAREGVEHSAIAQEAGGLSGAPVRQPSTKVISRLSESLNGRLPIIGVGGITDAQSAIEKIEAGASLVQLYSGFIYQGPALIREAAQAIADQQNS